MIIQIDAKHKTISIGSDYPKLGELIDRLNKLFQGDGWKEFKIIPHAIDPWDNPIKINEGGRIVGQETSEYIPWTDNYEDQDEGYIFNLTTL